MKDFTVRCPECKGTGRQTPKQMGFTAPCKRCGGKGKVKMG